MALSALNRSNFDESTNNIMRPTLVEFYSPNCPYCKRLEPILEDIKSTYGDSKPLFIINVDEEREIAYRYGIRSVPTTILMKRGTPALTCLGCLTKAQLLQMYDIASK